MSANERASGGDASQDDAANPAEAATTVDEHPDVEDISIADAQARLAARQLSSRGLVERYLERIQRIDRGGPTLRSVIEINPDAVEIAAALDAERARGELRGPLHGIPVLVKDNIDTADRMQTTAGSLALVGSRVAHDAVVVQRLRQAGAVVLGKTNLSEWANFRSTRSSSGWSGRGRQTRNPYVLDRSPGGSSSGSGVAVAANLCIAALGTETDGSIMSPSSVNGVVGLKPTVGLTSRQGVIPISHTQDSVGPHARSVADAAIVLTAIAESGIDYARGLVPDGLRGARVGVARRFHTGYSEHTDRIFEQALEVLRDCGAVLIEDLAIPGHDELRANFESTEASWEQVIMEVEFKAGLARYLASRPDAAIQSLADLIRFNVEHAEQELAYFGQERLVQSEARGDPGDPLYLRAVERSSAFKHGFASVFEQQRLDALVAPTNAPACAIDLFDGDRRLGGSSQAAAVAGCPLLTVPAGYVADLLPLGLTFMGPPHSEPTLLRLGYAFEQATRVRRPPRFVPTTLDLP